MRFTALNQARRVRRAPQLFDPDMPDPTAPVAIAPVVSEVGDILPDQTGFDDHVLNERRKAWKAPQPRARRGYLSKYTALATSASTGGVLKW